MPTIGGLTLSLDDRPIAKVAKVEQEELLTKAGHSPEALSLLYDALKVHLVPTSTAETAVVFRTAVRVFAALHDAGIRLVECSKEGDTCSSSL